MDDNNNECLNFKIVSLNVAGWTEQNQDLRVVILKYFNADVLCIQETHSLSDIDHNISLPDYKYISHCRKNVLKRAKRGYGGVGIFI